LKVGFQAVLDYSRLMRDVAVPPFLAAAEGSGRTPDVMRALLECGWDCNAYALLGGWLPLSAALARTPAQEGAPAVIDLLPSTALLRASFAPHAGAADAASMRSEDPDQTDPFAGILLHAGLRYATPEQAAAAAAFTATLLPKSGPLLLETITAQEGHWLVASLGTPRIKELTGSGAAPSPQPVATMTANLSTLATLMDRQFLELSRVLTPNGFLASSAYSGQGFLTSRLVLSLDSRPAPPAPEWLPAVAVQPGPADMEEARCRQQILGALYSVLDAWSMASDDARGDLWARGTADIKAAAARCEAFPAIKASADKLMPILNREGKR
jgi:hypothetical protein